MTNPQKQQLTTDECVEFCLLKATSDKKNKDIYLEIAKRLLKNDNQNINFNPPPYITFPQNDWVTATKEPDFRYPKIYCDAAHSNSSMIGKSEAVNE